MIFSLAIFLVVAGSVILMARAFHPLWWQRKWVRRSLSAVVVLAVVGLLLRAIGMWQASTAGRSPSATIVGAALVGPAGVFLLMLFVSLPLAALLRFVMRIGLRLAGRAPSSEPALSNDAVANHASNDSSEAVPKGEVSDAQSPPTPAVAEREAPSTVEPRNVIGRRSAIEAVVASVPIAALGAGLMGVVGAYQRTEVRTLPMRFADLPDDLRGLRILQLTDLHLGAFLDLGGLDKVLEDASAQKPDLVLITGDFSDHLPWLGSALSKVSQLKPRLGAFGIYGNHEHYRGTAAVRRIYEKSPIELLVDDCRTLRVGNTEMSLVGLDDPARGGGDDFYQVGIDHALDGSSSSGFKVAMCHRPSGFPTIAARGIDLTLSGHTHGAQVGLGERSILEHSFPEARLWGRYAIGKQQLYTSSGGGHWFAFRLNCPSEAPIITLERA